MNQEDQVAGQSVEKAPVSLDEQFDRGWEQVELATNQEKSEKTKPKEEVGTEDKIEKGDSNSKKPFKVLKVQGKEFPVATEEEYDSLASKGADYTKKTQVLADDRRGAEKEVQAKADRLADVVAQVGDQLDKLMKAGILPEKLGAALKAKATEASETVDDAGKADETEKAIFTEFQIDPSSAYPHEKKIVKELVELRDELRELRIERATATVETAIAEERESFPYDDIKDDQGNDLTKKELWALVVAKRQEAGVEKPDLKTIMGWAKEAVRVIHDKQRNIKSTEIVDDMDPAEFMKKFPKLAASLKVTVGAKAIEENEAEKAKVPPSLKATIRPADLTKKTKADAVQRKSFDDFLNAGFEDPETIKALTGG